MRGSQMLRAIAGVLAVIGIVLAIKAWPYMRGRAQAGAVSIDLERASAATARFSAELPAEYFVVVRMNTFGQSASDLQALLRNGQQGDRRFPQLRLAVTRAGAPVAVKSAEAVFLGDKAGKTLGSFRAEPGGEYQAEVTVAAAGRGLNNLRPELAVLLDPRLQQQRVIQFALYGYGAGISLIVALFASIAAAALDRGMLALKPRD